MYRGIILQMDIQYKNNKGQVARLKAAFSSKFAQEKRPCKQSLQDLFVICFVLLSGPFSS